MVVNNDAMVDITLDTSYGMLKFKRQLTNDEIKDVGCALEILYKTKVIRQYQMVFDRIYLSEGRNELHKLDRTHFVDLVATFLENEGYCKMCFEHDHQLVKGCTSDHK